MGSLGAAVVVGASLGAGAFVWTLTEYGMHRFAMHGTRWGPLAAEHRRHHRDPLLTSTGLRMLGHLGIWLIATLAGWVMASSIGPAASAIAVGWAGGYSAYEMLHWRSHHREPAWRYTRWLQARHEAHHVGGPTTNIGVTSSLWDRVFGTAA